MLPIDRQLLAPMIFRLVTQKKSDIYMPQALCFKLLRLADKGINFLGKMAGLIDFLAEAAPFHVQE